MADKEGSPLQKIDTGEQAEEDVSTPGLNRREFVATVGVGSAAAMALASGVAKAAPGPTPIYRIHPAIGIARVGNASPNSFFIGPEIPGQPPSGDPPGTRVPPLPGGSYKDPNDQTLIKPQGARFRIWEYRLIGGVLTPIREVNLDTPGIRAIEWTVHVANRKSAFYIENGAFGETLPAGPLRNPDVTDRNSLVTDFGQRTISGRSMAGSSFEFRATGSPSDLFVRGPDHVTPVISYLGQLRTDSAGRLIFIGGDGKAGSSINPPQPLTHWSNNNNWFDGIADGPVSAVVTLDDGSQFPMDSRAGNAWVLTGPPDFAPPINGAVSLYDVLFDMGVRNLPVPANALYQPGGPLARMAQLNLSYQAATGQLGSFLADFATEIEPILMVAVNYVYVTGLVNFKHSSMLDPALSDPSSAAAKTRQGTFTWIRPPDLAATNGVTGSMPRLYGDDWYQGNNNFHFDFPQNGNGNAGGGSNQPNHFPQFQRYLTLTRTQFALMQQWNAGNFIAPPGIGTTAPSPFDLDRAALEHCIGGAFYPGIEVGWQIRNPRLFAEPFRLDSQAKSQYLDQNSNPEGGPLNPGHFSRQQAVPWQADFNDCVKLLNLGWWPSARPDDVFLNATDALKDRVPWARPTGGRWPSGSQVSSHEDMLRNWSNFGFVVQSFGGYVETERAPFVG